MANNADRDRIRDLIHRRGVPPVPASSPLTVEVRTDGILPLPPRGGGPDFAVGRILIEWVYGVPLVEVEKFNIFLEQNEAFIAACCAKLMKGVAYRGTYVTSGYGEFLYKSLWSYDSAAAFEQWNEALKGKSKFVTVLRRFRSYWTRDPHRAEHCYQLAGLVTDLAALAKDKPFLQLTLAAAGLKTA